MTNSRQKGKRIERAAVAWLRSLGFPRARRGQQFRGTTDSPDVMCEDLPNVYIEVKGRAERPSRDEMMRWMQIAETEAAEWQRVALIVYANRARPMLVTRNDFGELVHHLTHEAAVISRLNLSVPVPS